MSTPTGKRRIGVFICHCGGNISDYVDVEKVVEAAAQEPGVVVAKRHVFTCSDAAQQDMIDDIRNENLDGLVIASCSPKLHQCTFRGMAERGGLNPYRYIQVNLREQCAWVHTDDREGATEKGIAMVRAGIAKCALSKPLNAIRVETVPRALVLGGGVAGMRSALALSDLGISVYLAEKSDSLGGRISRWGSMFPDGEPGREIARRLAEKVRRRENIVVYTNAELVSKSGSIGDFTAKVRVSEKEAVTLNVGVIVVATGAESYEPSPGEFGYGLKGVLTFPEFHDLLRSCEGDVLEYDGRPVRSIAYVYCVGSRQKKSESRPEPNEYCSRYCCTAACHTAVHVEETFSNGNGGAPAQFHLYRDMRTYGHSEIVYEKARETGSIYLRYSENEPPTVEQGADGRLRVRVKDELVGGEEIEIPADLVVLVTGLVPRENAGLIDVLKLPLSKDGFFNEIHIKLRPVETVIDGVYIAGTSQGPKSLPESAGSAMAAVAKAGGLLKKGYVDLEPLVAKVDTEKCVWCDECMKACPYGAVQKIVCGEKEVATVIESLCKGEGACVPVCPHDAIDVEGYTDVQITAMIDAASREVA